MDWKDLSRLAGHKPLRFLDITGLDDLEDVSALTGLPDLAEVRFRDNAVLTDCRPLLDMPSLKRVTMTRRMNSKAYFGNPDPVMVGLEARCPVTSATSGL
ncbi:hypothetical protein ACIHCQ_32370 [Streptomyces sp. NPDC052236]|uniref:hypothetical protein n=1 Tax=Streptomyces sp. NPDC052236 TaxID=3365686 RepID=UPI0037D3A2E1